MSAAETQEYRKMLLEYGDYLIEEERWTLVAAFLIMLREVTSDLDNAYFYASVRAEDRRAGQ